MRSFWLLFLLFISSSKIIAQENSTFKNSEISTHYFYGYNLPHSNEIGHLITGKPHGFVFSWNKKTFGKEEWSRRFNYPDQGISFIHQDMANSNLGEMYGIYGHMNFYFFNRHLLFRVGEGVVFNTNPYHREKNFRNNAYGSRFLFSTAMLLNFSKKNIYKGFGVEAGALLVHYSNGNVKSPNTSTNSLLFNIGLTYNFDYDQPVEYIQKEKTKYSEPLHYNFVVRTGINEGEVVGMGQKPFLNLAVYADKRFTRSSTVQFGTEVFFSGMLKELIKIQSISYPEKNVTGEESSTRVGLFGGYQLSINKISVFTNLGYYVYYPFNFRSRSYVRLGIQRELPHNFFVNFSVHAHAANAESAAISFGYRL